MSEEEYIYDFYRNKLRSGLWTNDYKKLDLLVEVLKKENLSREQRIKLRRYINVDKMTRNDLFAIMTISTNVLIAAFIGFGAARAALENRVDIDNGFIGAIIIILIFSLILIHLSRRKTKAAAVMGSLNVYEDLLKEKNKDAL